MKFEDFYLQLTEYAPIGLSDRLCALDGMRDNSGVIVAPADELTGVLFTLDLSVAAVAMARKERCSLIVTHHPAIFSPLYKVERGGALYEAINSGIGVVSMHLNLDCASRGIDYYLADGLGAGEQTVIEDLGGGTGYGRCFDLNVSAREVEERYKRVFGTEKAWLYGGRDKFVGKVCSFCGAGLDEAAADAALSLGADMVVSADVKHHVLLYALERGLSVLACTHYATENYGMKKVCGHFADENPRLKIVFYGDDRLI